MERILITGGEGDIAKALVGKLSTFFLIEAPGRDILDVTSIDSVDSYLKDKVFDIVVNNAGTLYSSLLPKSEPIKWIRDINVNLIGTYLICRAAIKRNKRVKIINIASTAAFNSYPDWTSYCASKAGVLKISEGLVKDGYHVITLCPGAIETKIRNGLNISNDNVMSVDEAISPILSAINGEIKSGDIFFYRKNFSTFNPNEKKIPEYKCCEK